ncbi:uncharacterized protein AB9W97_017792 isoform 1-T2 [Spinachia spinachia]
MQILAHNVRDIFFFLVPMCSEKEALDEQRTTWIGKPISIHVVGPGTRTLGRLLRRLTHSSNGRRLRPPLRTTMANQVDVRRSFGRAAGHRQGRSSRCDGGSDHLVLPCFYSSPDGTVAPAGAFCVHK